MSEEQIQHERGGGATPSAPAPDVSLRGVTKLFGDTAAVAGIDLDIEHGEFFSLLGPSGCGKSTTLAIIGGFEEPDLGVVSLGGRDVNGVPPYRRDVNTVFQSYALFPHLDIYSNIAFGLRRRRLGSQEIRRRVGEALELVDLPGLERRKPAQLSGGQQQRVALARALVNEPRVLLLDEPLGALDLKLRKQMQVELKRIQRDVAITFLYVTHDQEEALAMSDRLAVMSKGLIEQVGEPTEVYDRPATEFVAGFLGASNLLAGRVVERGGGTALVRLHSGPELRVPEHRVPAGQDAVKVGVRPEKLRLAGPGGGEGNELVGRVNTSTYLGLGYQLIVDGPDGTPLTVYVQATGERPPAPGDEARLVWSPAHTFVVRSEGSEA